MTTTATNGYFITLRFHWLALCQLFNNKIRCATVFEVFRAFI